MPDAGYLPEERILVVDDLPANIDYLAESLNEEYQLSVATSGAEALCCAQSESQPDIILLDVMMPGMDGYTVCKALKENPLTRDIPVIFITARDTPEDELLGLQSGAIDFLTKPVNIPSVKAKISSQLELKKNREKLIRQAAALDTLNQKLASEIEVRKEAESVLLRREAILDSVNFAAEQLALFEDWHVVIPQLLSKLGASAGVDRAYICLDSVGCAAITIPQKCYSWEASTQRVQFGCASAQDRNRRCLRLEAYCQDFYAGEDIIGPVKGLSASLQNAVCPMGAKSLAIRPIMHENMLWGFLGLEDCASERTWMNPEIDALNAAALILGAAMYRRQVEEKLIVAKNEAVRASQVKSKFLAAMSHEIRTPMNSIIGMTGLVLDSSLDAKQRHCLDIAATSANGLLVLLNDILDFSKIEANQLTLENRSFTLQEALELSIGTLRHAAHQKGLDIHLRAAATLPLSVLGDEFRLRQILLNLISNAIKFSSQGSITVAVDLQEQNEDNVLIHFVVVDKGIGIPSEKQAVIFESFTQADSSVSRMYGGTGLGLSISQKLVRLMAGEMWLESTIGQGSSFHFTVRFGLPTIGTGEKRAAEGMEAKADHPENAGVPENGRKSEDFTLLVVEDNYANQELARILLEDAGYRVDVAADGIEAMRAISQHRYDLILIDMQMPHMDGLTSSRYIRACEQEKCQEIEGDVDLAAQITVRLAKKHLPIIAMTANAMGSDRQECLAAGMDGYMSKPILAEIVFATLDTYLGKCDRCRDSKNDAVDDSPRKKEDNRLHEVRRFLLDKIGVRADRITPLLEAFRKTYRVTFGELRRAQEEGDAELLFRTAHTIKGAVLNLGMEDMADVALIIEQESRSGCRDDYDALIQRLEDGLAFLL